MSKDSGLFRMKQFSLRHSESAIKIGTDAVLLGAWASVAGMDRILDVGTGCGIIALMMAQRNIESQITGLDCDKPSIEEARMNFLSSKWSDRLNAIEKGFIEYALNKGKGRDDYSLIISNPPFYNCGLNNNMDARCRARHVGELSPGSVIKYGAGLLSPNGIISLIIPFSEYENLRRDGLESGFNVRRMCRVRGRSDRRPNRMLIEFSRESGITEEEIEEIVIREPDGSYSEEYRRLTSDFYTIF